MKRLLLLGSAICIFSMQALAQFDPVARGLAAVAAAKTLSKLRGRQVWVPICGRRGPNGSAAWYDATDTAIMDQVMCYAPSWGQVTALKLVYSAFDLPQQGEVDRPVTATLSNASIFVPTLPVLTIFTSAAGTLGQTSVVCSPNAGNGCNGASAGQYLTSTGSYFPAGEYVSSVANSFSTGSGNTPTGSTINLSAGTTAVVTGGLSMTFTGQIAPVRFGGKAGVVITPAHDVVTSDPVSIALYPNEQFFIRNAATFSGVGMQLMDMPGAFRYIGTQNEFSSRGTILNDQTLNPTNLSNTGGGFWAPTAVLALVTPTAGKSVPGAVLLLGDSIGAGTGDQPDSLYAQGYIQRAMENSIPFVSLARGSTTAAEEAYQGAGQFAFALDTGITDVLVELGRNDILTFNGSASALESQIGTITSRYTGIGKRVWCFTIPPTTLSTDGWTTLANQSWIVTNYTASGTVASGAGSIVLSGNTSLAVGQMVVVPPVDPATSAAVTLASSTITLNSSSGITGAGQAIYGPGLSTGTTLTGNTSNVVTLSTPTIAAEPLGAYYSLGTAIYPGTTISSLSGGTIQLSHSTVGTIASGTTVDTGQSTASAAETQRETYNTYLRSSFGALGCSGVVDDDAKMADAGGSFKWRADLGPASIDGVHPQAVLHTAAVSAIPVTNFVP